MGYPVVHLKMNNGVNYEHDQNVEEKEKSDVQTTFHEGISIEEQSKDTNRQKGTKQTEEVKKGEPEDRQEHSACHRVATLTA
uniref:Uncharacterized protein n=1 Tax=Solanum tuberosum TaxID=4113 RepID=M1DNL8_SOLTU